MPSSSFISADAAQSAFYAAFEAADLDAMMAVWADDAAGVECIHPGSARLQSLAPIRASWQNIFAGGPSLRFELSEVKRMETPDMAVHIVHENIRFGPGGSQAGRVIATNVYRRLADGWLMVLHHGSPANAPRPASTPGGPLH